MISIRSSEARDLPVLVDMWHRSVKATHHILDPGDFEAIAESVARDYLPAASLWIAVGDGNGPIGFMGMRRAHIDSLFIDPDWIGRGVGSHLLEHARHQAPVLTVDVNEQNDKAVRFHKGRGSRRIGRSPLDDAERPYPLLYLRSEPLGCRQGGLINTNPGLCG